MEFWFCFILFLMIFAVVGVPIVYRFVKSYKSFIDNSKGVKNYDSFMREFCYRVNLSKNDIIEKLKDKCSDSTLNYNYNADANEIVFISDFTDGYEEQAYYIEIKECSDYSLLKIVQQGILPKRSWYPYKQNEFWSKKIGAVPILYFEN